MNAKPMFISLLLVAMTMLIGCGGDGDDDPKKPNNPDNPNNPSPTYTLLVSPTQLTFNYDGGEQTIDVTTNAPGWTAESNKSWCTTKRDGTKLTIRATANNEGELRTAVVTVKTTDGKEQRTVTVTQTVGSGASYIRPVQSTITFSAQATKIEEVIRVETNLSGWTCSSNAEWCMARCDATNLYLFIIENILMDERKAVVTLSHEGTDYAQVFVTQEGVVTLYADFPDGQTLPVNGGSIKVKIYTNIKDWTAAPTATNCWFSVTKSDNETLTLTASARQGTRPRPAQEVKVTADYETLSFTISEATSSNEGYGYGDGSEWDE